MKFERLLLFVAMVLSVTAITMTALNTSFQTTPNADRSDASTIFRSGGPANIPIIPASWLITDWYLDGTAGIDGANTGLTAGSPLKTFQYLWIEKLGCAYGMRACPRWQNQAASNAIPTQYTIHINGPLATSDVVYAYMAMEGGAFFVFTSDNNGPTVVQGTIVNRVNISHSVAAPTNVQYGIANADGGVTTLNPGTVCYNTTRGTKSWPALPAGAASVDGGAPVFNAGPWATNMVVPLLHENTHPSSSNTTANTDSVTCNVPNNFMLGEISPTFTSFGDGGQTNTNQPGYIYNLTVGDGVDFNELNHTGYIGGLVSFVEVASQYPIDYETKGLSGRSGFYNSYTFQPMGGKIASTNSFGNSDLVFYGGVIGGYSLMGTVRGLVLDGEIYGMANGRINVGATVGSMFLAPNTDHEWGPGEIFHATYDYANFVLYSTADGGAGNVKPETEMNGNGAFFLSSGTYHNNMVNIGTGLNQLPLTPGQQICAVDMGATNIGIWNCNQTVTPDIIDNEGGLFYIGGGSYQPPGGP